MAKDGEVLEQETTERLQAAGWEPMRELKWVVLFFFTSATSVVYPISNSKLRKSLNGW